MARELDDPDTADSSAHRHAALSTAYDPELSQPYFAEANELATGQDDPWMLEPAVHRGSTDAAMGAGDPAACQRAAAKALEVAERDR